MTNGTLAEAGSETVASDCWPSAELQVATVICHVWSSLSTVSTTAADAHCSSSSFPLARDETNFWNTPQCASLQTSSTHLTEKDFDRVLALLQKMMDISPLREPAAAILVLTTIMTSEAKELVRVQHCSTKKCRANLRLLRNRTVVLCFLLKPHECVEEEKPPYHSHSQII